MAGVKGATHAPLRERFERQTVRDGKCLRWIGGTYANGYGTIGLGGREGGKALAHRVAWFLKKGEWPEQNLLHTCDNKWCVEVEHLFEGSHQDNSDDMISKGRQVAHKLGVTQVLWIRQQRAAGTTYYKIAEAIGVHKKTVMDICNRKIWRHV